MKQQVVFIHGGESKDNYVDYKEYLYKLEYKPFEKKKKWKMSLDTDLGNEYELYAPAMPNKGFSDYEDWKIMFEKTFKFLDNGAILVGHSLGGTFLVKYLNENDFPFEIKKIILVAAAFEDSKNEVLGNFNFDQKLNGLKKYEDQIVFYHSKDDLIVPFVDLLNFQKILPNSKYKIFEDKFHFVDETFPELIDYIKSIK